MVINEIEQLKRDNEVLYRDNVALSETADRLREALEEMVVQDGCDCGHPACKRCRRTVEARAAMEQEAK